MTHTGRTVCRPSRRGRIALPWLLGAALGLLATGCTDVNIDALCEGAVDCAGGGDRAYDDCVTYMESYSDIAEVHGCEDEWEEFLLCFVDHADCDEDADKLRPDDKCDDEGHDLDDCFD